MSRLSSPYSILGQGLAGSCLAWELLQREIPFQIQDRGHGGSSRVAAGLINPITGKNFEPSWLIDEFYQPAIGFFRSSETELGSQLWYPLPILRLASTEKEWKKISSKVEKEAVSPWISKKQVETKPDFHAAVELKGGGRVDTAGFVEKSAEHFRRLGLFCDQPFDKNHRLVRCQGSEGLIQGQLGPHRCAKGEILTIRADHPDSHIVIGAGGWLVPMGGNKFRVGSTYEWDQLDETPTSYGTERISTIAAKLLGIPFEIVNHVAGIRPILRRSQPLIGPDSSGDWAFNGLGSKGTLYAPRMAKMLVDWMEKGEEPADHFRLDRFLAE